MKYEEISNKINECKNKSLDELNIDELDDISNIKIDKRKSSDERLLDFLSKTKNLYAFKINGKIVKIEFSETDLTANDCLTNVLDSLYK